MNGETRDGVSLTNLAQPLFDGAEATKRDLVDYLDAVRGQFIPVLRDRPLSVIRVLRGQPPFMQKNVPRYAPPWVRTVQVWAEASRREVSYALCDDRRTLLWLANQRAAEFIVAPLVQTKILPRLGPRAVIAAGMILGVIAMIIFTRLTPGGRYATHVLPGLIPVGAGAACVFSASFATAPSASSAPTPAWPRP